MDAIFRASILAVSVLFYAVTYIRIFIDPRKYSFLDNRDKGFFLVAGICLVNIFFEKYTIYFRQFDLGISPLPGIAIMTCATILVFISQNALGTSWSTHGTGSRLVTSGIYRHVRHPIYLGMMIFFTGFFLSMPSLLTLILLAGNATILVLKAYDEEAELARKFGDTYKVYSASSGFLLPKIIK